MLINRLIRRYAWLVEANSAAAASCYTADPTEKYRCATTFVGPMNMGASFNKTSWRLKGDVIGTEFRAFNNLGWDRGGQQLGLTGYGPNINIARDPRFGRTSELPSEDPVHSGAYGREMITGMQTQDAAGHPKMLAHLKHYTVYSREQDRMHSEANVTTYDLHDSYLAQYEEAFKANASGVMCSYDSINGVPACANDYTLNQMIRQKWGASNAFVSTDCGAVLNMMGLLENHPGGTRLAATFEEAAAWSIMNGTDLEMGSTVWTTHLESAVKQGLATEEAVTRSLRRGLRNQFVAGRFDANVWSDLGVKDINSTRSQQIQNEAALQGMVLLKNTGLLPLKKGSSIAVVGPLAEEKHLTSDYAGGGGSYGGCLSDSKETCIVTIADAIAQANTGGATSSPTNKSIEAAVAAARAADTVVLSLGEIKSEGEGHDRPDINLDDTQLQLAAQVLALGRPTLLVLSNGCAVALDGLIEGSQAIVETFDPGHNTPQVRLTILVVTSVRCCFRSAAPNCATDVDAV